MIGQAVWIFSCHEPCSRWTSPQFASLTLGKSRGNMEKFEKASYFNLVGRWLPVRNSIERTMADCPVESLLAETEHEVAQRLSG